MAINRLRDGTLEIVSDDGLTSHYLDPESLALLRQNGFSDGQQPCNSDSTALQHDCNSFATDGQQLCNDDTELCNSVSLAKRRDQTKPARDENDNKPAITPAVVVRKNKDLAHLLQDEKFMKLAIGRRDLKHFFSVPDDFAKKVNLRLGTNYSKEAISKVYQSVKYEERFSPTSVKMIVAFFVGLIIWLCIKLPGCAESRAPQTAKVEQTAIEKDAVITTDRQKEVLSAIHAWEIKNKWKFTDYRDTLIVHNFHGDVKSADFSAFCQQQKEQMMAAMSK